MTQKTGFVERVALIILCSVIAYDSTMYAYLRLNAADNKNDVLRLVGREPELPPIGYGNDLKKIDLPYYQIKGWVVRYADKKCTYCRQDDAAWTPLAEKLRARGYIVFTIPRSAASAYAVDDSSVNASYQPVYVEADWIKKMRITYTPTVMMFDRQHGLEWSHQGILTPLDVSSALASARTF